MKRIIKGAFLSGLLYITYWAGYVKGALKDEEE